LRNLFKDYSKITAQLDNTGEASVSQYFSLNPEGRKPTKYAKKGWTEPFYRLLQDNFRSDTRIHKLARGSNSLQLQQGKGLTVTSKAALKAALKSAQSASAPTPAAASSPAAAASTVTTAAASKPEAPDASEGASAAKKSKAMMRNSQLAVYAVHVF